jgi:hypothetical protein
MRKKPSQELREYMREMARLGGKTRAKKYGRRTLSKWGKLGGRPPKAKKRGKR